MNHNNKIALITGGSRGLGRQTALKLASEGADVVLTYRSRKSDGQTAVAEIEKMGRRAAMLQLDTGSSTTFADFAESLKELLQTQFKRQNFDYLINNAGHGIDKTFVETTEEEFDALMNVHVKGVFFLTQQMLPLIKDGGRIINLSSGLTRFTHVGRAAYAIMKSAVETLTRYMALELGERKITANVVAPGIIETDLTSEALTQPGVREHMSKLIALGRVGVPEDIAGAVSLVCSDDARWITGQRIEASGGMNL